MLSLAIPRRCAELRWAPKDAVGSRSHESWLDPSSWTSNTPCRVAMRWLALHLLPSASAPSAANAPAHGTLALPQSSFSSGTDAPFHGLGLASDVPQLLRLQSVLHARLTSLAEDVRKQRETAGASIADGVPGPGDRLCDVCRESLGKGEPP